MKMVLNLMPGLVPLLAACAPVAPPAPAPTAAAVGVRVERESYVMGTVLRGEVAARSREAGMEALERAFAEVRRLEELLSSWRDDSELARVNRAPAGTPVRPAPELLALLEEARRWAEATGGAFDPGVGALTDAWQLRGAGREPSEPELAKALASTGIGRFAFDARAGTVARPDTVGWLDTGGFGKGAALRSVERILRAEGVEAALLDFGGQILALGAPAGEAGWRVAVAHPSRREEAVEALVVRDRSVSTTSQSERWVEAAGERLGHVLDPRTGRPVPAWGSVTVVAEDALSADALSTALFVMGPEEGMRWAKEREDVGVLFLVERAGGVEARWTPAMHRYRART
jgi:thiamine biosynthesis lipoprotein